MLGGESYRTLERKTPFGKEAYVYWISSVGGVTLKEDGSTGGVSSYIKKWKYEKE